MRAAVPAKHPDHVHDVDVVLHQLRGPSPSAPARPAACPCSGLRVRCFASAGSRPRGWRANRSLRIGPPRVAAAAHLQRDLHARGVPQGHGLRFHSLHRAGASPLGTELLMGLRVNFPTAGDGLDYYGAVLGGALLMDGS